MFSLDRIVIPEVYQQFDSMKLSPHCRQVRDKRLQSRDDGDRYPAFAIRIRSSHIPSAGFMRNKLTSRSRVIMANWSRSLYLSRFVFQRLISLVRRQLKIIRKLKLVTFFLNTDHQLRSFCQLHTFTVDFIVLIALWHVDSSFWRSGAVHLHRIRYRRATERRRV